MRKVISERFVSVKETTSKAAFARAALPGDHPMVGAIRKRDIIAHPLITIHCFGWHVFVRALVARRNQTFLELLATAEPPALSPVESPDLVDRCIKLELSAMQIYQSLAKRWAHPEAAETFFATLGRQEQGHADLLKLCQAAAKYGEWNSQQLVKWEQYLPHLEEAMRKAAASLDSVNSLADALRLVLHIESSEVNRVFLGVIQSNESEFVTKLRVFQSTTSQHITFICQQIPTLEPALENECRGLLASFNRS